MPIIHFNCIFRSFNHTAISVAYLHRSFNVEYLFVILFSVGRYFFVFLFPPTLMETECAPILDLYKHTYLWVQNKCWNEQAQNIFFLYFLFFFCRKIDPTPCTRPPMKICDALLKRAMRNTHNETMRGWEVNQTEMSDTIFGYVFLLPIMAHKSNGQKLKYPNAPFEMWCDPFVAPSI